MDNKLYHPYLIGKKCYLRGLESSDLDLSKDYFQWFNDQDVTQYMSNGAFPNSEAKARSFYEAMSKSDRDLVLAIISKADNCHIGNLALHRINWVYRCAELGIIIGSKKHQGQGLATEAMKLIMTHGFQRLNLHKIYLMTDANNTAAVKAFQKVGFQIEGTLRESVFRNGKYADSYYMGCLASEFKPV